MGMDEWLVMGSGSFSKKLIKLIEFGFKLLILVLEGEDELRIHWRL